MGKTKVNIPMLTALILLLLTMLSLHLTSGLYARYTVNSTASDSARVAKFDVQGAVDQASVTIDRDLNAPATYKITVTNNSEVAIRYSMKVKLDKPLNGTEMLVTRDNIKKDAVTQNMTFSNIGQLAPGGTGEHTLVFEVADWKLFTKDVSDKRLEWKSGFTVEIIAEQID